VAPGREPEPRAFSENLRVLGVYEMEVAVCDVFRVGGAIMQVSRGRRAPSWPGKSGKRLLVRGVAQTGYTGLYLRVLSEGVVAVSDVLECIGRCRDLISITHTNDVICDRTHDSSLVERPADLPEFTASGCALFARRLERRMNREERTGRRVRAGEGVSWV